MDTQYSEEVLWRYYDSPYVGCMDESAPGVITHQVGTPDGGEVIRVQMKVSEEGLVEQICFKAHGSCATIAAASYVCEKMHRKPLSEVNELTAEEIVRALKLPKVKIHSALLAIDAVTCCPLMSSASSAVTPKERSD